MICPREKSHIVVYRCLRHAVTLSKNARISSVTQLRNRLIREGWNSEVVDMALDVWRRLM